jgi:hypothetical protein
MAIMVWWPDSEDMRTLIDVIERRIGTPREGDLRRMLAYEIGVADVFAEVEELDRVLRYVPEAKPCRPVPVIPG